MHGYFYLGLWEKGKPFGFGITKWEDGVEQQGYFSDLNIGYGHMVYPSGKLYEGNWVYKRRHGWGILKKKGKKVIEGNWVNNMILQDGEDSFNHEVSHTKLMEDYGEEECKTDGTEDSVFISHAEEKSF